MQHSLILLFLQMTYFNKELDKKLMGTRLQQAVNISGK